MSRIQKTVQFLEWPVAMLAILVIPALVIEERATTPQLRQAAVILN